MPSTAESRRRREPLNSCSRTQAERQVYSRWTGYRRKLTLAVHRLKHPYPCASRTSPSAGQPRPPLCSGIAHGTNPPRALSQNGSFSAVSKPNFASKYSLESSRRDLQDLHAFAPLRPQYFRKFSSNFFAFFGKILQNSFFYIDFFSLIFAQILMKSCRNFADILENVENNFRNF